jgi:predicted nucleic acid-binding Zn ribbon protein
VYALKELLGDALTALMGPRRARQTAALDAWAEVVGAARAQHAKAVGVRGSVLVIATDLPAVYYELGLRRRALVETLNQRAGGEAITDIQFVMRPLGRSGGENPPDGRDS